MKPWQAFQQEELERAQFCATQRAARARLSQPKVADSTLAYLAALGALAALWLLLATFADAQPFGTPPRPIICTTTCAGNVCTTVCN